MLESRADPSWAQRRSDAKWISCVRNATRSILLHCTRIRYTLRTARVRAAQRKAAQLQQSTCPRLRDRSSTIPIPRQLTAMWRAATVPWVAQIEEKPRQRHAECGPSRCGSRCTDCRVPHRQFERVAAGSWRPRRAARLHSPKARHHREQDRRRFAWLVESERLSQPPPSAPAWPRASAMPSTAWTATNPRRQFDPRVGYGLHDP